METSGPWPPSGGNAVSVVSHTAEKLRIASLNPGSPSVACLNLVSGLMRSLRDTANQFLSSGGGAKSHSDQIGGVDVTVNPKGYGFAKCVLQIQMAGGKYESYLRELGYAQLQATKMVCLIATGDLPKLFQPPPVVIGGVEISQEQLDRCDKLDLEVQLMRSNLANDLAEEDVAKANAKIEGLVNQTTRFLNEAVELTPLGRGKLAQEWELEQKMVVSTIEKLLQARMLKDEKGIADYTVTCTTDSLSPAHSAT